MPDAMFKATDFLAVFKSPKAEKTWMTCGKLRNEPANELSRLGAKHLLKLINTLCQETQIASATGAKNKKSVPWDSM